MHPVEASENLAKARGLVRLRFDKDRTLTDHRVVVGLFEYRFVKLPDGRVVLRGLQPAEAGPIPDCL